MPELDVFARLNSSDWQTRRAALDEVGTLLHRYWRTVLGWATQTYPSDTEGGSSMSAELLRHFNGFHPTGLVEAIEAIYDSLVGKERARETAIRVLMETKTEHGLWAVLRLLRSPASREVALDWPLYVPLRDAPAFGLCLFPSLVEVIPELDDRPSIYKVVVAYANAGRVVPNRYRTIRDHCLSRVGVILDGGCIRGDPTDQEDGRRYILASSELDYLLDLLRFFPSEAAAKALRRALEHPQLFVELPLVEGLRMKMFAACSLLARGQAVEGSFLETVAAIPLLRWRLWWQLQTVGRADAFPSRYHTQAALAEAEMVEWLEYPTEMGYPPEQIEPLTVANWPDPSGEKSVAYFFKFRHRCFLDGDWYVGMAGPYPVAGPARLGSDSTFSTFRSLAEKPVEEHVKDYLPSGSPGD